MKTRRIITAFRVEIDPTPSQTVRLLECSDVGIIKKRHEKS